MSKVYLVISCCGEYDDYLETVKMAFTDVKKAEDYVNELRDEEQGYRDMANKCRECMGIDKLCPCYTSSFDVSDECEAYNPYHDEREYRIDEVELVE